MKGRESKPHIGIFGRRNNGKSSLINAITGQETAIVDATAGTTTDPVKKSIEIFGIGPAVVIDTAGIDDEGAIGQKRIQKSLDVLKTIDFAILVITAHEFEEPEQMLADQFKAYEIPYIVVNNKSDLAARQEISEVQFIEVRLTGKGLIDGTGVLSRGEPRRGYTGKTIANKALALKNCKDVEISGLQFLSCGHFAMLLTGVDNLMLDDVTIDSNRDGIDIDCCENVIVRHCRVNTLNDDAIVLKCSYALGWAKPTAKVIIEDCYVSGYDTGSFLDDTKTTKITKAPDRDGPTGRIKLGTESNGGFRDIIIRNCTFEHCRGLALETVDGAAMENISVSGLKMNDICNSPIYIRLGDRMRGSDTLTPSSIRGISIKDVTVTDADCRYACLIAGLKGHPVKDVTLTDISIEYRGGITLDDYRNQRGTNPFFYHEGGNYPEPAAHGIQPAWGLSMTYAEDITLNNVNFKLLSPDERPMIFKEHTKRVNLNGVN